jgi:hypothetical protein
MADYITLAEFKQTSETVGFAFQDYDAGIAISAASEAIDQYCGRTFGLDSSSTVVRYYTPLEPGYVNINDLVTCGTVAVDVTGTGSFASTWTLNTDFVLEPFNAAADGVPFETIRVHPRSALRFPCWPRSVQVTGQFGWPAVPGQVKQATTVMTTRLLKRAREAPFGIVGANSVDANPIRISRVDPDIAFLLDNLIRGQTGGAVMVG